ncbi:unnamed protein product [Onchocerca flexuosa]|uniref:Protein kinase domain-containing protein n=1 Tax=Onchocerca flexuosa TaxID=387005 RepID=A0A183HJ48_9BILA|nr:unnamed protein product [Onchocerca flexuosa]
MLVGIPPFQGDTITDIYAEMLTGRIHFPKKMDYFIKDFIKMLLQLDPAKRLGNLKGGVADIKIHKWFSDIIWDDVINMKITVIFATFTCNIIYAKFYEFDSFQKF